MRAGLPARRHQSVVRVLRTVRTDWRDTAGTEERARPVDTAGTAGTAGMAAFAAYALRCADETRNLVCFLAFFVVSYNLDLSHNLI